MPTPDPSNSRENPFAGGAVSWRAITGEPHTIKELNELPGIYGFRLIDWPEPGSVVISGFSEILTGLPAAGEYRVDYIGRSGLVIFDIADALTLVLCDYNGGGSVTSVENFGLGSSGGSSGLGINYIANSTAEAATVGWSGYADAPGVRPVDGTGGSPGITWTRFTTDPLRGNASFLLTKDAVNRQGEGESFDFPIDNADRGRMLAIQIETLLYSGTFQDGDIVAYIYDRTNARLIEPVPVKILAAPIGMPVKLVAYFQAAIDSNLYRLCLHIATTSTAAFQMQFDSITVGPQLQSTMGVAMTDPKEFGPLTIDAVTTPPTKGTVVLERATWARIGAYAFISYEYVQSSAGSAGTGVYKYPMPPGLVIDHNRAAFRGDDGITSRGILGHGYLTGDGSSGGGAIVRAFDANFLSLLTEEGAFVDQGDTQFSFGNASLRIHFTAMVPIVGWATNVEMSADADTRVCAARANGTPANASAGNPVIYPNTVFDTHGAYDAATGEYVCPASGFYEISGFISLASTSPPFAVYVDGVQGDDCGTTAVTGACTLSSGPIQAYAGQRLSVRPHGSAANGFVAGGYISFKRLSGPAQIAASEKVFADYYVSSNYSCNANEAIDFDSKIEDSHGCVTTGGSNTWKFTSPQNRRYMIAVCMEMSPAGGSILLWKNGAPYKRLNLDTASGTVGTVTLRLLAGEYISINTNTNETITGGTGPMVSMISIESL